MLALALCKCLCVLLCRPPSYECLQFQYEYQDLSVIQFEPLALLIRGGASGVFGATSQDDVGSRCPYAPCYVEAICFELLGYAILAYEGSIVNDREGNSSYGRNFSAYRSVTGVDSCRLTPCALAAPDKIVMA